MKYWLIAVSSPVRTSLSSSTISGFPCTAVSSSARRGRTTGAIRRPAARPGRGDASSASIVGRHPPHRAPAPQRSASDLGVERAVDDLGHDPPVVHGLARADEHGVSMPSPFPLVSSTPNTRCATRPSGTRTSVGARRPRPDCRTPEAGRRIRPSVDTPRPGEEHALHVVVVGCGRVGSGLARILEDSGHTVAVVDKQPEGLPPPARGLRAARPSWASASTATACARPASRRPARWRRSPAATTPTSWWPAPPARSSASSGSIARIYDPRRAAIYERLGIPTIATVQWTTDRVLRRILPGRARPPSGPTRRPRSCSSSGPVAATLGRPSPRRPRRPRPGPGRRAVPARRGPGARRRPRHPGGRRRLHVRGQRPHRGARRPPRRRADGGHS